MLDRLFHVKQIFGNIMNIEVLYCLDTDHSIHWIDIERMVAMCLKLKICCVSGRSDADIHHANKIGMGNDRTKVDHSNYRRMPLCRELHIECHAIGQEAFNAKYHVVGVYSHYHNGTKDEVDDHLRKGGKLTDYIETEEGL